MTAKKGYFWITNGNFIRRVCCNAPALEHSYSRTVSTLLTLVDLRSCFRAFRCRNFTHHGQVNRYRPALDLNSVYRRRKYRIGIALAFCRESKSRAQVRCIYHRADLRRDCKVFCFVYRYCTNSDSIILRLA